MSSLATAVVMAMMISMTADVAQGRWHIHLPDCSGHWWCPYKRVPPPSPPPPSPPPPSPKLINVGSKSNWGLSTEKDLKDWSKTQKIFVGDTLFFRYDSDHHNVIQLYYQKHYDNCGIGPNSPTWNSGFDKIKLNQRGVHFFVCGFSCKKGMKINVTVN